mgnify:CR=1 FL=1
MTAVLQRPRLTFAVGITGHRPNKLPPDAEARAASQLTAVLAAIDAACAARREKDARFYEEASHRVRLLSSFAEGVDRLAVKMRPAHWEVTAVLPFPRARYEQDFVERDENGGIVEDRRSDFAAALRDAAEVVELAEGPDGAPADYARAGAFVLRQIDLLVAVWDGAAAAGTGGTAHVVAQALEGGIPVIWISTTREQAPALIGRLSDADGDLAPADATAGQLAQMVDRALILDASASRRLEDFLEDTSDRQDRSLPFLAGVRRLCAGSAEASTRSSLDVRKDWRSFLAQLPEMGALKERLDGVLLPRFVSAETRAIRFRRAGCKADGLLLGLALLSVALALAGVLPIRPGETQDGVLAVKAGLALLELLAVIAMVRFAHLGRSRRRRSLDCRALAMALRQLRFLVPVGEGAAHRPRRDRASQGVEWASWYLRATMRELGSPGTLLDACYLRELLLATERAELDRLAACRIGAKRLGSQHSILWGIGHGCFVAAIALLAGFALLVAIRLGLAFDGPMKVAAWEARLSDLLSRAGPVVSLLAALLPATGAMLAWLTSRTDPRESSVDPAPAMSLQSLKSEYAVVAEHPDLDSTAELLRATARAQIESTGISGSDYGRRRA